MPETHSKLATELAIIIVQRATEWPTKMVDSRSLVEATMETVASHIDERMAENRQHLKPVEFARCPYVTHHPTGPCHWCVVAALREFILLPEDL